MNATGHVLSSRAAQGQPVSSQQGHIIGILLAAGRGRRFDPSGQRNKLLQPLPDGTPLVVQSARTLAQAVDTLLAVVPGDASALEAVFVQAGVPFTRCPNADDGMAESLKAALQASVAGAGSGPLRTPEGQPVLGWVVALGDMPFVNRHTMMQLAQAVRAGAQVAVPVYMGQRGNPVAFSASCFAQLLALSGDEGARSVLQNLQVQRIAVDDPGVVRDVDTPGDVPVIPPLS
jgi:molybdenum cofactor cytidylyltransferase